MKSGDDNELNYDKFSIYDSRDGRKIGEGYAEQMSEEGEISEEIIKGSPKTDNTEHCPVEESNSLKLVEENVSQINGTSESEQSEYIKKWLVQAQNKVDYDFS